MIDNKQIGQSRAVLNETGKTEPGKDAQIKRCVSVSGRKGS